jgi:hypothetical protein
MKHLAALLLMGCYTEAAVPLPSPPPVAPTPPKPASEVRSFNRKVPPVHAEWLHLTLPSEKAAKTITAYLEKNAIDAANEFIKMTQKAKRDEPQLVNPDEWDMNRTCRPTLLRAQLVSVRCDEYEYAGGAHGMTVALGWTWRIDGDEVTKLALNDIFVEPWIATVDTAVIDSLRRQEAQWVIDGSLKSVADMLHTWNLTPTGVTFAFNPYEAGPYAQGPMDALIPWNALAKVIRRPGPLDPLQ